MGGLSVGEGVYGGEPRECFGGRVRAAALVEVLNDPDHGHAALGGGRPVGPSTRGRLVTVALVADLPPEQVPWWCEPDGARRWAETTLPSKNPIRAWWRSSQVPVWNRRIVRPLLIWDGTEGVRAEALTTIRDGEGADAGPDEPSQEEYVMRIGAELEISLAELQRRTHEYETDRTARLGVRADAVFVAAQGYLDVLGAETGRAQADGC